MRNQPLSEVLRHLQSTNFRELAGARISARIPVDERLINELVAASLPQSRHLREAHVRPEANDRFAVRLTPASPLMPALTVKLQIEQQPQLPASPVLGLRLATMGGLLGMAGAALPLESMLPAGVRLEGDRILVDLRAMAAQRGVADLFEFVRELRITTEAGKVLLHLEAAI